MSKKSIEFIRFLLGAGADPNQDPDCTGFPLALVAAIYADKDVADLLLERGAKMEHSGALSASARRGNEDMVRYLLERGAKLETDTQAGGSSSALSAVASQGHVEFLTLLLGNVWLKGGSMDVEMLKAAKKAAEKVGDKG
jgi:ankyrin repeat protein